MSAIGTSSVTLLFLVHLTSMVSSKLICDIYSHIEYNGRLLMRSAEQNRTYRCDFAFDTCCEKGCCTNPWQAFLFLGAFCFITIIAVLVVFYCLNILIKSVYDISRQSSAFAENSSSKSEGPTEAPPAYEVALYLPLPRHDDSNLPTFEEAVVKK